MTSPTEWKSLIWCSSSRAIKTINRRIIEILISLLIILYYVRSFWAGLCVVDSYLLLVIHCWLLISYCTDWSACCEALSGSAVWQSGLGCLLLGKRKTLIGWCITSNRNNTSTKILFKTVYCWGLLFLWKYIKIKTHHFCSDWVKNCTQLSMWLLKSKLLHRQDLEICKKKRMCVFFSACFIFAYFVSSFLT